MAGTLRGTFRRFGDGLRRGRQGCGCQQGAVWRCPHEIRAHGREETERGGKRLERGRFAPLWERAVADGAIELTMSELALYLEGSRLAVRVALSPPKYSHKALANVSHL